MSRYLVHPFKYHRKSWLKKTNNNNIILVDILNPALRWTSIEIFSYKFECLLPWNRYQFRQILGARKLLIHRSFHIIWVIREQTLRNTARDWLNAFWEYVLLTLGSATRLKEVLIFECKTAFNQPAVLTLAQYSV